MLEVVERPISLEGDTPYKLLTAKRSRGGIVLRGELPGREVLTKTQFVARGGDFLMSRRQIIHGACGVVPPWLDGAVVSNEYSTLRTRPSLLMEFLNYFAHTPYFQRACFHSSHGVDVEKMVFKLDRWLAWPILLPPLAEQKKIAAILSSVDEAIEKTQAVIDQVQVVKKGLMQELLTRGLPGRHKKFKKTEIGEIPEEWLATPLNDCVDQARPICYGILMPGRGHPGGVQVVKVKNLKNGRIDYRDLLRTSPEIDNAYARSRLKSGDLLLSIRGTTGRVAVVPPALEGANITQDTARIAVTGAVRGDYLRFALDSDGVQRQIADHTIGQAVKGVNIREVRRLLLPLPLIDEQDHIVRMLGAIESSLVADETELEALKVVKSALMSVLLTGEVRVKPDSQAA